MLQFTHLITEAPCYGDVYDNTHIVLEQIKGFTRVVIDLKNLPFIIKIQKDTKLCILQRKKGWNILKESKTSYSNNI
jgi:hypothetical protein